MVIIILSAIGVVLFVVGISFAFRGYLAVPAAASVVPRPDFDAVKKDLASVQAAELKVKNEFEAAKTELEAVRESFELTRKAEETVRKELERVRRESEELKAGSETQLAETLVLLNNLKTESESVKTNGAADKAKIERLESEIAAAKEKTIEQAKGALDLIDSLKAEKVEAETFKSSEERVQLRNRQLEEELMQATKTINDLRAKLDSFGGKAANDSAKLKELESRLSVTEEKYKSKLDEALKTIDNLNIENESLKSKAGTEDLQEIKTLNEGLAEKEKAAQYELAKSKAQVAGLEKICADFKVKFESIEKLENELKEAKNKIELLGEENNRLKQGPNQTA